MTYRTLRQSDHPQTQSGIFLRDGSRSGQAPNLLDFVDEVRWLTTPAVAAAVVDPLRGSQGDGVIASSSEVTTLFESRLRLWLSHVERTLILEVPSWLSPTLGCMQAIAVPMWTPLRRVGVLALPDPAARRGVLLREIERRATDFALRIESHDRRVQLNELRRASLASRPSSMRGAWQRLSLPVSAVRHTDTPRHPVESVRNSMTRLRAPRAADISFSEAPESRAVGEGR
ncbi:MAG: hypothetical protein H6718_05845 [Polyangiaceae bacterium]|nr:hypothetical protein [Polyangiaceae bacterium]MCB9607529.1 hypothetical protein [Polyangiaceae bacterium]